MRIPALGTVTPLATVTVRTQISGVTAEDPIHRRADWFTRATSLAQIDPRPYEAALQQVKAICGATRRCSPMPGSI